MNFIGYDYHKCAHPETMSKDELLSWAYDLFNIWGQEDTNQSTWYVLLLWAERE